MSKKRSKSKNKRMKDSDSDVFIPEEPKPSPVARLIFRPGVLLLLAAGVGLAVFGPKLQGWLPDLSRRGDYLIRPDQIRVTEAPPWIPKTFLDQVAREGELPEKISLLDDAIVDRVAAAFQKQPWVERVVSVRKDFTKGIDVVLEYRKPVAAVVVDGRRLPVDHNAVLLPPEAFEHDDSLPTIVHVTRLPAGAPGTAWGDRAIEGAARLAEVLGPSWQKLKLQSIEVPEVDGGERALELAVYQLNAAGGSRVIWGRAPGSDHPGELTPQQKLGRLEEYCARHGGFSDEQGPYVIDIRHWQEITRQPLSERPGWPRQ
jgi:hypothetical protein